MLIRTKDELQKLAESNPFAKKDINRLYVTFLSGNHSIPPLEELNKAKTKSEEFFISGKRDLSLLPGWLRKNQAVQ